MFNQTIFSIAEDIIKDKGDISVEQALDLALLGSEDTFDLILFASKVRKQFKRKAGFKCAIINAKSGRCPEDCAFCAQSAHHKTDVDIYELISEEALVEGGLKMAEAGADNYSVVTSGTSLNEKDVETLCKAARSLKEKTDLTLCASVGLLSSESAYKLKEAGITRYHHNLETARSYFDAICTTHKYDDDIETVRAAKASGMMVCSGGIFGMGESWEQRVELAFTLKDLDVDSVAINFLNPIEGTPMRGKSMLSPFEALKCIALYRFIHPRRDITVCGGREATLKDFQSWVFTAGANGLMVGNYLTTKGRNIDMDIEMIQEAGIEYE